MCVESGIARSEAGDGVYQGGEGRRRAHRRARIPRLTEVGVSLGGSTLRRGGSGAPATAHSAEERCQNLPEGGTREVCVWRVTEGVCDVVCEGIVRCM